MSQICKHSFFPGILVHNAVFGLLLPRRPSAPLAAPGTNASVVSLSTEGRSGGGLASGLPMGAMKATVEQLRALVLQLDIVLSWGKEVG